MQCHRCVILGSSFSNGSRRVPRPGESSRTNACTDFSNTGRKEGHKLPRSVDEKYIKFPWYSSEETFGVRALTTKRRALGTGGEEEGTRSTSGILLSLCVFTG
jgi:hypothetical protein